MPSIQLGFSASTAVILLLIVVGSAVAFLFYRYTLPPVSRGKRTLLAILRAAALSLLLMLLLEPLLRLVVSFTEPPGLAVLVDNSKSMRIVDRKGNRAEQLASVLKSNELSNVGSDATLLFYTFGTRPAEAPNILSDSLQLNEDATDIAAALRRISRDKDQRNIQAALLLTDGMYNLGSNPIHDAEQLGLPLYTVGIGDSSEQKDIVITKIATNDLVFNESEVPVDVTIKSSGFGGERVEVVLGEGAKELNRTRLVLGEGTREYPVRLTYVPEGEGTRRYTVRVSSLPGELTEDNNRRSFFARVLKSKLRTLIIAGSPSPDLSIVKQTLVEEKNISVRSYTQRAPSGFYEGSLRRSDLDSADCIILIGFPTQGTSPATLDLVRSGLIQDVKPLFFINGKAVDSNKLHSLGPVLPFILASAPSTTEQYVFFQPADAQRLHPILVPGSGSDIETWKRLPPIFKTQTTYRAKPEAVTLGVVMIQNITTNEPLILIRNVNRQKSLAVVGYGIWRWRLMAQGSPETEKLFGNFLANTIRWLTTKEDDKPVKVTTTKQAFTEGEPVEFVGQVYDASANPVDNAQLRITAMYDGREYEAVLRPIGSGRYEGTIDGLSAGDYTFRATAQVDGQPLGEDRGRFSVGELNLEFQDTRMDAPLLRQLAFRTGGESFSPEHLANLQTVLRSKGALTSRELQTSTELELWNWQYTLGLIILLLGVEWFVRKRSGML